MTLHLENRMTLHLESRMTLHLESRMTILLSRKGKPKAGAYVRPYATHGAALVCWWLPYSRSFQSHSQRPLQWGTQNKLTQLYAYIWCLFYTGNEGQKAINTLHLLDYNWKQLNSLRKPALIPYIHNGSEHFGVLNLSTASCSVTLFLLNALGQLHYVEMLYSTVQFWEQRAAPVAG